MAFDERRATLVAGIVPEAGWGIKETVERCLACEAEGVATPWSDASLARPMISKGIS